jgi:hypothetical protein
VDLPTAAAKKLRSNALKYPLPAEQLPFSAQPPEQSTPPAPEQRLPHHVVVVEAPRKEEAEAEECCPKEEEEEEECHTTTNAPACPHTGAGVEEQAEEIEG